MPGGQFLRWKDVRNRAVHSSQGALGCRRRLSLGLLAWGLSSMNSDLLRPSTSAARLIIAFCFRLARRLIVSPRPISLAIVACLLKSFDSAFGQMLVTSLADVTSKLGWMCPVSESADRLNRSCHTDDSEPTGARRRRQSLIMRRHDKIGSRTFFPK